MCRRRNGFTLVELLAVIAVIGVLLAMLLPAVQSVREGSRRTLCMNNMRQVNMAVLNYESSKGFIPVGKVAPDAARFGSSTWLLAITCFMDQSSVYAKASLDYRRVAEPFQSHIGMRTVISSFQCPSDPVSGSAHWTHTDLFVASTSYLGVNGTDFLQLNGAFNSVKGTRLAEIKDGLSNTLLCGERPPSKDFWYGWWYAGHGNSGSGSPDMLLGVREINNPTGSYLGECSIGPYSFERGSNRQCDTLHFWSYHPHGANFSLVDGSVKFVPYDSNSILPHLSTIAGAEVANMDF